MIKKRLFTPGPTDVPPEVLNEMAKPIFHHRTAQFREMFAEDVRFSQTVVMNKPKFGRGTYRYFSAPLPPLIESLCDAIYPFLLTAFCGRY